MPVGRAASSQQVADAEVVLASPLSSYVSGQRTKLRGAASRKVLLVVGCLVFAVTAGWIATFPISMSI
jgi:hypothetical protein